MAAAANEARDFFFRAGTALVIVAVTISAMWQERTTASGQLLRGGISAAWLADYHRELGYSLDDVRRAGQPVPRVMLAELPMDLAKIEPTPLRKQLFIEGLLPIVLGVNERIASDRDRLVALLARQKAGEATSGRDKAWLEELAMRYGSMDAGELLRRVDVVPPSLAIAQAAIESGWGSSRFARQGNALFGQRVYGPSGMQPAGLTADAGFGVRDFKTLGAAVAAYADNLNSFSAYDALRAKRASLRAQGQLPDGLSLAGTLLRYSELGGDYVAQVRELIRINGLGALDKARLAETRVRSMPPAERQADRQDI
jgi:Bax protein